MTRDEALQKALDAYDQAVSDRAADNLTALLAGDVDAEQIADFIELSRPRRAGAPGLHRRRARHAGPHR